MSQTGLYVFCPGSKTDPSIHVDHAFEVPNTPGVKFHDMVTVSLGDKGFIDHIINNAGGAVPIPGTNTGASYLVNYP